MSLWALAKLGYHPGRILVDFGTRIEELVGEFNPQACANTLWALSVLQVSFKPLCCHQTLHACQHLQPGCQGSEHCKHGSATASRPL